MGPAPPGPAAGASFSFTALTPEVRGPGVAPPRPASDPGRPADAHPRPRWGGGTRPPIQLQPPAPHGMGGGEWGVMVTEARRSADRFYRLRCVLLSRASISCSGSD